MNRNIKRLCIGMAVLMTAALPLSVAAATPEFGRTEEEWARLRDDVIEYDELADLIHEYNPTVRNNRTDYNDFVKEYGRSNESISKSYHDAAQKLYGMMSGENNAASLISDLNIEMQAKKLLENADETVDDSTVLWLGYEQIEKNLAAAAQSYMITYYKSRIELEEAKNNIQQLELQYQRAVRYQAAGTGTAMDVLTASETLQTAQSSLYELETGIENTYKNLSIMLGWNYEDSPQLADLPDLDYDAIAAADPEKDRAAALENNYTLKANKRKLENASTSAIRETLEQTIKNNERQIASSLTLSYQGLQSALIGYEQAQADLDYETQNRNQIAVKYQAGMVSQMEYQTQEYTYSNKQLAVEKAYLNLFQALETYRWSVFGLANAE